MSKYHIQEDKTSEESTFERLMNDMISLENKMIHTQVKMLDKLNEYSREKIRRLKIKYSFIGFCIGTILTIILFTSWK